MSLPHDYPVTSGRARATIISAPLDHVKTFKPPTAVFDKTTVRCKKHFRKCTWNIGEVNARFTLPMRSSSCLLQITKYGHAWATTVPPIGLPSTPPIAFAISIWHMMAASWMTPTLRRFAHPLPVISCIRFSCNLHPSEKKDCLLLF